MSHPSSSRPNNWPPPPASLGSPTYPFPLDGRRSPTSTSQASSDASEPSPSSPMPLVLFPKLQQAGNGPMNAIQRMREEKQRVGTLVSEGRYTASIDDRSYLPVFEFPLGSQTIMMDSDSGYVLWTSIWKALGNSKADIVKLVDSYDGLEDKVIKIRGGFLKIQGTWLPYEVALKLAQRVAYNIRHELVHLFGSTFPDDCFVPGSLGYGQVTLAVPGSRPPRRAPRRLTGPSGSTSTPTLGRPPSMRTDWTSSNPAPNRGPHSGGGIGRSSSTRSIGSSASGVRDPSTGGGERWSPYPPPNSTAVSSSYPSPDPTYEDYYRNHRQPPPSSYGAGQRGFHLPSPVGHPDPLLRSQHSDSSLLPRSRQSTYSADDAQVLRRFSTSLAGSPTTPDFGFTYPSSSSFGSSSSAFRSAPPPSAAFSLPPISSMTQEFAVPGIPSSVSRRSSQQQTHTYRIPLAEEQYQRRRQGSPPSPGSSSDSHSHHSSFGSQGGSSHGHGQSVTPLTPLQASLFASNPSSTSPTSLAVFEGGPSYLPPISAFDGNSSFSSSSYAAQRGRSSSLMSSRQFIPSSYDASPSTVLQGLRFEDESTENSGDRSRHHYQEGYAMDINGSSLTETGRHFPSLAAHQEQGPAHVHGLGMFLSPHVANQQVDDDASLSTDEQQGDVNTSKSSLPPPPPVNVRQRSTSFRPW